MCHHMCANALMIDGKRDGVCLNLSMAPHRSFQKPVLYTIEALAIYYWITDRQATNNAQAVRTNAAIVALMDYWHFVVKVMQCNCKPG